MGLSQDLLIAQLVFARSQGPSTWRQVPRFDLVLEMLRCGGVRK